MYKVLTVPYYLYEDSIIKTPLNTLYLYMKRVG